ncbi:MAG: GNAT family N-acetyltransferase, partial [Terriglobia bacterium]
MQDTDLLERRWLELESRSDCSFFQSWTFTGCLIAERFPDPFVFEVYACRSKEGAEERVALALFNRRRGRSGGEHLLLGESGIPSFDSVFIEHNGPLIARGFEAAVLPAFVHAAIYQPLAGAVALATRRVVFLSGIGGNLLAAARSTRAITMLEEMRLAPALDLGGLRRRGVGPLERLSANTRYQLRRSARRFAAAGPLSVRRAGDAAEGHLWLEALSVLHQRTWERRGQPGAFADANFRRFHHALIDRGFPKGEVDLLEIS